MATFSSFLRPTSPPKPKAKMCTSSSATSPLGSELHNTNQSFIRTPSAIASSSSSILSKNRHFTPRKRSNFHSSTPPTPRSTPCSPRSNFHYSNYMHQHQNMPYIPTIPPYATLTSLEAHRIHLLNELQSADFQTTTILRSLHAIQSQLDHPLPLPPHEVKALRKNAKIQRGGLWKSEQREMGILVQLGEVALRTQRIGRWERVCWEGAQGSIDVPQRELENVDTNWVPWLPAMPGQDYRAQTKGVYRATNDESAPAAAPFKSYDVYADAAVPVKAGSQCPGANEVINSSPPNFGQPTNPHIEQPQPMNCHQAQYLVPPAFAWQQPCDVGGNRWNYYNTSGVTSAATSRRNTAIGSMLPPVVPHNSPHCSIAALGQSISGIDLSQRIEQAVGSARFRKSEPGLVGQWSAERQGQGYV